MSKRQCPPWWMEHLVKREDQPAPIRFLLWLGFVKFGRRTSRADDRDEVIIWPFHAPPMHIFRYCLRTRGERVYRFRNLPGVIKWLPGRVLPKRWGFGICGFEFGDRG